MSSGGVPIAVRHIEVLTVLLRLAYSVDCTCILYSVVVLLSTAAKLSQSINIAVGPDSFKNYTAAAHVQLLQCCSMLVGTNVSCTVISLRSILSQQSIMRMSEAHARMHLRDHVREDDVDVAIQTILEVSMSVTAMRYLIYTMCVLQSAADDRVSINSCRP
jgi:MCM AAA-lid domain